MYLLKALKLYCFMSISYFIILHVSHSLVCFNVTFLHSINFLLKFWDIFKLFFKENKVTNLVGHNCNMVGLNGLWRALNITSGVITMMWCFMTSKYESNWNVYTDTVSDTRPRVERSLILTHGNNVQVWNM